MCKPKVAVYKLSSCAGCQLEFLNLEGVLIDIAQKVDFSYFPMASSDYGNGPFEVGFVEGAVTTIDEIKKIKEIRDKVNTLVALGSCACYGGVASIKNSRSQRELERSVYKNTSVIYSTTAYGIDHYVEVDEYLRGCPIDKDELLEFIKSALLGIKAHLRAHSVCMECKLQENPCVSILDDKVCLGPISSAGCGALCPTHGRACEGCRGPSREANVPALVDFMRELDVSKGDIKLKLVKYAGETRAFKKGVEYSEQKI